MAGVYFVLQRIHSACLSNNHSLVFTVFIDRPNVKILDQQRAQKSNGFKNQANEYHESESTCKRVVDGIASGGPKGK